VFEVGIVGAKNSGKTTLIEMLIKSLRSSGFRVATIKHSSHDHLFDTVGKDSYRHRQAGAELTLAISDSHLALFDGPHEQTVDAVRAIMGERCDFCLVEGELQTTRPKVLITRLLEKMGEHPQGVIASYGPKVSGVDGHYFESGDLAGLTEFLVTQFPRARKRVTDAG